MKLTPEKPVRNFTRGTLGWVFGLSVTIFLISMWGRAIIVDTDTLAESLSPLSGSAPVVSLISDWLGTELLEAGANPDVVDGTVDVVVAQSEVAEALSRLVAEVILAAGSPTPGEAVVDAARILRPAAPAIAETVTVSSGSPVSPADVTRVLDQIDPLVVRASGDPAPIGPSSPIAGRLSTAAVLALVMMVIAGWGAVRLADERAVAVKGLLTRVSLGALSFAVMLRIGSWVLSPTGGRAPISSTLSGLFESKWLVPLAIGVIAGVGAGVMWGVRRIRSKTETVQGPVEDRSRSQEPGMATVVIEPSFAGDPAED